MSRAGVYRRAMRVAGLAIAFASVMGTALLAQEPAAPAADPGALSVAYLGAGIGLGLIVIGAGLGIGRFAAAAAEGIARQPSAADKITGAVK
jgi:F0F1-type ATP synthase membrane subunit c/vacuolar-type H+-ATPase subunit K